MAGGHIFEADISVGLRQFEILEEFVPFEDLVGVVVVEPSASLHPYEELGQF